MITRYLSDDEAGRISRAIEDAEAATSGEIFVVVAARAGDYRLVPVLWAAIIALLLAWPLHLFTGLSIGLLLAVQGIAFILWAVALSPDTIRYRLIPPALSASETNRAAREQFMARGIHLTEARTGILIYVALMERRVEIVADDGIAEKVEQADWDAIAGKVAKSAFDGRLAEGLIEGVQDSGRLLATHFPPRDGDRNELPNVVVQL